jgi:hypothetical protein
MPYGTPPRAQQLVEHVSIRVPAPDCLAWVCDEPAIKFPK